MTLLNAEIGVTLDQENHWYRHVRARQFVSGISYCPYSGAYFLRQDESRWEKVVDY